jgi:hypothetical protein
MPAEVIPDNHPGNQAGVLQKEKGLRNPISIGKANPKF